MKTKFANVIQLRHPRILLIEDDHDLAEMLMYFFKMEGYACQYISDSTDVLPIVGQCQPDLVLIDYLLPMVNGGELCSMIKQDELYKRVPVILFSAYPKVLLSLGNYQCDAFVAKPFDLSDLKGTIENLLQGRLPLSIAQ